VKTPYRFRVPEEGARLVRGLHPLIKQKVRSGLEALARDPHAGKALRGELEGLCSLRVGRFRIVYRVSARRVVEVVTLGPRKAVYEETLRLLRKERALRR
jgi:mRNA interferase RelE/StbE